MRVLLGLVSRVVLIVTWLTIFAAVHTAHACQCPFKMGTASELLRPAQLAKLPNDMALFVGRVISQVQLHQNEPIVTTFQVMKVVKGDLPRTITLSGVTSEDNSCGLNLYVSQIGLLLIQKNSENEWSASVCAQPRPDVDLGTLLNSTNSGGQK